MSQDLLGVFIIICTILDSIAVVIIINHVFDRLKKKKEKNYSETDIESAEHVMMDEEAKIKVEVKEIVEKSKESSEKNLNETAENPKGIYLSRDFEKKDNLGTLIKEKGHTIVRLYVEEKKGPVWTCPNCETENGYLLSHCSVCCHER